MPVSFEIFIGIVILLFGCFTAVVLICDIIKNKDEPWPPYIEYYGLFMVTVACAVVGVQFLGVDL